MKKERNRVLIVEDDELSSMVMSDILNKNGYATYTVHSGGEAVDIASRENFDLVLTDINLGDGDDGIEVARRILEIQSPAIVFLTAYSDEETVSRAKELKPQGYIVKPFSEENIVITSGMAIVKNKASIDLEKAKQREENLRKTLEAIFDNMNSFVLIFDKDLNITYINSYAFMEGSFTNRENLCRDDFEALIIGKTDWDSLNAELEKENYAERSFFLRLKDGRIKNFKFNIFQVYDANHEKNIIAVGTDISETLRHDIMRNIMSSIGFVMAPFLARGDEIIAPIVKNISNIMEKYFVREDYDIFSFAYEFANSMDMLGGNFTIEEDKERVKIITDVCIWGKNLSRSTPFFCSLCRGLLKYQIYKYLGESAEAWMDKSIGNNYKQCHFIIKKITIS